MTEITDINRRVAMAGALAIPTVGHAAAEPVVTVLGDSITAGYGLPASQALPAQLERELRALGVAAKVRGAGVSGDTTAGGLRRVESSVRPDTRLCVVALGGNDLLSFYEPRTIRSNLEGIVQRLKAKKMKVLLAGIQAPLELGAYARAFNGIYPAVAKAQGVPLHASLLAGVALDRRYNQPDLIHPNAAGVRIIAQRLARTVAEALRTGAAAAR
jgi:acyl-CoA thioesterase-1